MQVLSVASYEMRDVSEKRRLDAGVVDQAEMQTNTEERSLVITRLSYFGKALSLHY